MSAFGLLYPLLAEQAEPFLQTAYAQLGAVGLLLGGITTFFLGLSSGRIMVRTAVQDLIGQADQRVQQANEYLEMWHKAAEASDKRADEAMAIMTQQTELMRQYASTLDGHTTALKRLEDAVGRRPR